MIFRRCIYRTGPVVARMAIVYPVVFMRVPNLWNTRWTDGDAELFPWVPSVRTRFYIMVNIRHVMDNAFVIMAKLLGLCADTNL